MKVVPDPTGPEWRVQEEQTGPVRNLVGPRILPGTQLTGGGGANFGAVRVFHVRRVAGDLMMVARTFLAATRDRRFRYMLGHVVLH